MLIFIPFNFSHSPLWLLRFIVFPSFFPPSSALHLPLFSPTKETLASFLTLLSTTFPSFLPSVLPFIPNSLPCFRSLPSELSDALFPSCPLLHLCFYRHSLAAHTQISLLCFLKILQPIETLLSSASLFTPQQDVLETPYCPETPPSPSSANHFVSPPDCFPRPKQESLFAL